MSNPSRFDKNQLLDGTGGHFFEKECLAPELNRYQCDVRLIDDKSPLLPGTKVVLLLGQRAHTLWTGQTTTLDEHRGNPIIVNGIPCISSFSPQDTQDIKDYESKHIEALMEEEEYSSEESSAGDVIGSKGRQKTARSNYRFWLQKDTHKAIRILRNGGILPHKFPEPEYHIYPSAEEIIKVLTETKGQDFYIDIETDFITLDMRCFAFAFGNNISKVYVVPTLDIHYTPAYGQLPEIIRALAIAMRDNTTIAHNGALFDFFVFAYKYHLPVGKKVYDTMVAQHRIYPTVEKSLGHCISLWTYLPYHKNEGTHGYHTIAQAEQLYYYCGKDVYGMILVKLAQDEMASKDPGLAASIQQGNDAIRPYLIASLLGTKYDDQARLEWIKESDRLMTQYLRILRILTGPNVPHLISNQKTTAYFHGMMGYPIVKRTKTGGSSLEEDALLKLRLKHENPVIDFLIKYRGVQKEVGTLQFKPWIPLDETSIQPGMEQQNSLGTSTGSLGQEGQVSLPGFL